MTSINKSLLFVALFASISLCIYIAIKSKTTLVVPNTNHVLPASDSSVGTTSVSTHVENLVENKVLETKDKNHVVAPVQSIVDVRKKWAISRGYTYFIDNDEYKTYSKEVLQKLADTGDIRAMQTLAELVQRNEHDRAINLYNLAAVYGSTKSLGDLSGWAASTSVALDDINDKKSKTIEAMAYIKVAAMRGDNFLYITDMQSPQTANPSNISMTEDDYAKVKVLAQQIYDDLQKKRDELGLGAFDNSIPPEINQRDEMRGIKNITFRY